MQLATTELDPSLDPFAVAGSFFSKRVLSGLRSAANPQRLVYEGEKLRARALRLVEAVERIAGARSGPRLQIDFGGTERLERAIRTAGRRVALAMGASAAALLAIVVAPRAEGISAWAPGALALISAALIAAVVFDLARRRG